jgi:hypothetical protein
MVALFSVLVAKLVVIDAKKNHKFFFVFILALSENLKSWWVIMRSGVFLLPMFLLFTIFIQHDPYLSRLALAAAIR